MPQFDVINMLPSIFVGKNELVDEAKDILKGTNAVAFGQVLGKVMIVSSSPGTMIHVNDIASFTF
jgi:hypothetical protein